jgi:hypothetical protein
MTAPELATFSEVLQKVRSITGPVAKIAGDESVTRTRTQFDWLGCVMVIPCWPASGVVLDTRRRLGVVAVVSALAIMIVSRTNGARTNVEQCSSPSPRSGQTMADFSDGRLRSILL